MNLDNIHANAVYFAGKVFLLRGESASGKSDLTLRMINAGGKLIADDRVIVSSKNNKIYVSAPENLAGLLEVRGIGIVKFDYIDMAKLDIICDLSSEIERMPICNITKFYEYEFLYYRINPFEISVLDKLSIIASMGI